MDDEMKIYNYSKLDFFLSCLVIVIASLDAILNFFLPSILNLITAILWAIVALLWIGHIIHKRNHPYIATKKDIMIISRGAYRSALALKLNKIERIERKSLTKPIIWYRDKNNKLKKQRIHLSWIENEQQVQFHNYIEELIRKRYTA